MIESPEEFRRLRESTDPGEQHRAAHDAAPAAVWDAVVARWPELRFWVAQNKTVPAEVLLVLAADPDPRVRAMVAAKRRLPPAAQLALAAAPDEGVRGRLVHNAKATRAALERLAEDPWPSVAERARARLAAGAHA